VNLSQFKGEPRRAVIVLGLDCATRCPTQCRCRYHADELLVLTSRGDMELSAPPYHEGCTCTWQPID